MRRLAILLLAVASLGGARPWAPDRPGPDFDVLEYQVTLTPDLPDHSIAGRERITLRSLRNGLSEVAFTGNALQVTADGGDAASVRRRGDAWIVRLKAPLLKDQSATLRLRLSGKPARGLVFLPGGVYTSYFTCDWMVCNQDRPGDKATLSLKLAKSPFPLGSGGTGWLDSRVPDREGLYSGTWHFSRPGSSYLFGFYSAETRGFALRSEYSIVQTYIMPGLPKAEVEAVMKDVPAMADFFSSKAGQSGVYYVQLVVPGDAAQEAEGFSVLGWDTLAAALKDPQEDWLPAHEMAHRWWGNLVTCASWDDFWLNEGITSFMVAAWKEHRWGRAAYDREMDLFRARVAKARAAGVDVPLTFHGPYPSLGLKRAIVYGKGALFMDALRREMGEDAFWAGLKRYTRQFGGGAADSRDFQRAMQAETAKPLGPLFDAWVY